MAWVGRGKGKIQPSSEENKESTGKLEPGYGKDLNAKLRCLNKTQQQGSKCFIAKEFHNQLYTGRNNLINLTI